MLIGRDGAPLKGNLARSVPPPAFPFRFQPLSLLSAYFRTSKRKRADQLFEGEALSVDTRDEVRTEARVAKAALQEAREHKELMRLEHQESVERLKEHTIRSPVSGVVVDRLKSPGEVVKEETIVVLAQIDPLRVEVVLPAAVFGSVEPGMRAEVIPELPNAGVQVASVTIVDRVVDATRPVCGTTSSRSWRRATR